MTDRGLQAIESEARARVEEAASFSLSSSWPASEEVATQVTTINSQPFFT
jgi:TPP-dependent pyruvate/acetoin dehydrogenase alpha subunit